MPTGKRSASSRASEVELSGDRQIQITAGDVTIVATLNDSGPGVHQAAATDADAIETAVRDQLAQPLDVRFQVP